MSSAPDALFKILPRALWDERGNELPRAPIDHADGYMHLSTQAQVRETATLHFGAQTHLVLIRLRAERLEGLVFEPSRGGALFPHVYGPVPIEAVSEVWDLVGEEAGAFRWPPGIP